LPLYIWVHLRCNLMTEESQFMKFGIALPKPIVHEIEEEAKKLGMSRSEYIAKVLTGELLNNREREAVSKLKARKRFPADNLLYVRKLIEDSQDWSGGFDLENCASRAKARLLTGEELDNSVHPEALLSILRRYKEQADYWGYSPERRTTELKNFAKQVEINDWQILQLWKEIQEEGS